MTPKERLDAFRQEQDKTDKRIEKILSENNFKNHQEGLREIKIKTLLPMNEIIASLERIARKDQ